ncbi:UNKNOWN [Stylonychia lemnae]|uniref:Uncharacterized protein n=1 Tax=Stylonychia lemnae TaxID=5949 RepID=A0A078AGE8_STYLE|nr:UNKNOWN [Stylonychia lemnae]|eukprot:CDW80612.1 UNKNOWN [Stylonychia lemnae]
MQIQHVSSCVMVEADNYLISWYISTKFIINIYRIIQLTVMSKQKDRDSEMQQPLLEGQRDTESSPEVANQSLANEIKGKNPLPADYQWILEDHKEADYSKIEGRIKSYSKKLSEREGRELMVKQVIMLPQRDMILVDYYYDKDQRNDFVDVIDLNTMEIIKTHCLQAVKIFCRHFNHVDYVFYQQDQFLYLMKLDDFIESNKDNQLVEFEFQECKWLWNVEIIDESAS